MAIDAMIMLDKLHMCHELDTTSLDSRSVRTPVRQEQHLTALRPPYWKAISENLETTIQTSISRTINV